MEGEEKDVDCAAAGAGDLQTFPAAAVAAAEAGATFMYREYIRSPTHTYTNTYTHTEAPSKANTILTFSRSYKNIF